MVAELRARSACRVALTEVWEKGGAGGEALARRAARRCSRRTAPTSAALPTKLPIKEKIDIIVRKIYGGDGADYSAKADRAIEYLESIGLGDTPVCMAKTQYSLTDDATRLGASARVPHSRERGASVGRRGLRRRAGGDIMTMPGLPKEPAAEKMSITKDGTITGLF